MEQNETQPTKKEEVKETSVNPLLDQVRQEREALDKLREEAKREADRLEQLRSDQLLGSTGGLRQDEQPKEETPKEYAKRMMRGVTDETK